MKLHHLLQKCSFFLIKLAAFQASGAARMKLQKSDTVPESISPQVSLSTQRLSKKFFLGVLCELRGELLCFFFD